MKKNKPKKTKSTPAYLTNYGSSAVSSLPGTDDIFRETLPNGITVLVRSNFASPSVVMSGYLNAGSLFESDEKLGLADFTASMLMRGTQKRNFQQIYDAIESVGANMGFGGGAHTTGFSGRALTEDLPLLLGLMTECLIEPAFPDEQVERLRAQLLTSLAMRAQDTSDMASMAFDEIVFANHPYARPDDGYPETVKAISREDMISFHDRYFGPRGLTLAIVGAVESRLVMNLVAGCLGQWENPGQPELPVLPPVTPLDGVIRKHVLIPGKVQTDMYLGVSGPTRNSPDYLAVLLGNSVLGQFGMMGRIGDVVREKSGLAYYAYSSVSAGVGPGAWEVSAGVNNANVERAVELVREEIRHFVEDGVTDDELADSKANFIGRLPLSMESNMGVANSLLSIERYHLGMDYYRNYAEMVQSVTAEQVVDAARRYLNPDKLAIATAGG